MKSGQSAVEFMIIIGGILVFVIGFFVAIEINRADSVYEKRTTYMEDVALSIKDEINLAHSASDGYSRNFRVPGNAFGLEFNATIREDFVYLQSADGRHSMAYPILNVTGDVEMGNNLIEKINGTVYLNRI